jgi:Zn-dependent protease
MFIIDIVEILEIFATSLVLGYLFSHIIRAPVRGLKNYLSVNRFWNWADVKYSMLVVSPAIVLHEFGHKIAAISMGFPSRFHGILTGGGIVWIGAAVGLVIRLIGWPFIFLIPGYVAPAYEGAWASISAGQMSLIAFMGPAVNLALFLTFWILLKVDKWPQYARFFHISRLINGFLFVLNMLPLGPLDGAKVFSGLKVVLFG